MVEGGGLIDGFNEVSNNIASGYLKVGNDSMSEIRFCTTQKGKLPHLSYIFCKTEPMGDEFKTVARSITGTLIFKGIHIGKEGTNKSNYHLQLGVSAACMKRTIESTKVLGHRPVKRVTRDRFIFDSRFDSNRPAKYLMGVGADNIDMVKDNKKLLFKDTIYNMTKYWPGLYYFMLKIKYTVTGDKLQNFFLLQVYCSLVSLFHIYR